MSWNTKSKRTAGMLGLLGTGAIAGAIVAAVIPAGAATTSGSAGSSSTSSSTAPNPPADAKSSTPVRSDEAAVTGTKYDTLKAEALAAVPGGTVYRIETDADGAAYEAHMTKADGSFVTVKFDSSLKEIAVQDGMGAGGPAGHGGPGAPGASSASGTGA